MAKRKTKIINRQGKQAKRKIKVLGYCDSPTCATGFATVSRNIFEGLYRTGRFDIEILGINYWGDPHNFPYRIWPTGTNNQKDPYGRQKVLNMIPLMDFDILFFLQDSFILNFVPMLLDHLKKNRNKPFRSICYYPVDSIIKQEWADNIKDVDYLVAYSEFGKQETLKRIDREILVIPHGVNTGEFYPLPEAEVKNFRKQYFGPLADNWIITNVNRNQQRKDMPRTIAVFEEFRKHVPNSTLYLHCLAEGTEIRVLNGVKTIEDIRIGDYVLTHEGRFRRVYETSKRKLNKDEKVFNVYVVGRNKPITITEDHKVLAIKHAKCKHNSTNTRICLPTCKQQWKNAQSNCKERVYLTYTPEWIPVKELVEDDYLLIPRLRKTDDVIVPDELCVSDIFAGNNQNYIIDNNGRIKTSNHPNTKSIPNIIKITDELLYVFGLYVSEGCVRGHHDAIYFTFNINELEMRDKLLSAMKEIFDLDGKVEVFEDTHAMRISFFCTTLARLFKILFGHSAYTKCYPEIFNFLPVDKFMSFIKGMFDGDGHYNERFISYSSVSLNLMSLLQSGLLRYGIFSSLRICQASNQFNGYTLAIHAEADKLYNYFNLTKSNKNRDVCNYHSWLDNFVLCKIYKIEECGYDGYLYNMSVEEDESYCANGFIVHNCAIKDQGWDLAEVCKTFGFDISKDVIFPKNFGPNQGYPREVLNLIYNASDVVISTTHGEGMGLAWLESLATKTPIIMPNNTVMPEFITEDIGWLAKSGSNPSLWTTIQFDNEVRRPMVDVEDMVEKLLEIYNNPEEAKRRAENGYQWVINNMDWQRHIVPNWVKLFNKAYDELKHGPIVIDKVGSETKQEIKAEVF